jgi:hypothetical protein
LAIPMNLLQAKFYDLVDSASNGGWNIGLWLITCDYCGVSYLDYLGAC